MKIKQIIMLEWCTNKQNITHSLGKKINQLDKNTNEIIKTHDSIRGAVDFLGKKNTSGIINVLNFRNKTLYGFKWEYFKEE